MEKTPAEKIKLLPSPVDNCFRGIKISQYAFLLITFATIVRSLIHVFALDGGAQSIATIPLASYSAQAAAKAFRLRAGTPAFLCRRWTFPIPGRRKNTALRRAAPSRKPVLLPKCAGLLAKTEKIVHRAQKSASAQRISA